MKSKVQLEEVKDMPILWLFVRKPKPAKNGRKKGKPNNDSAKNSQPK